MAGLPSPAVAAGLSLLFPGLGQAYAGRPRRALLVALPALCILAGLVLLLADGPASVVGLLLRPGILPWMLAVGALLFAYHAAAMVDAYRVAAARRLPAHETSRGRSFRLSAAPLLVLLLMAAVIHGVPWYYGYRAAPSLATLFHETDDLTDWTVPRPSWESSPGPSPAVGAATPEESATPSATPASGTTALPSPTDDAGAVATPVGPSPSPQATPFNGAEWARDGQLNIVLLGSDEGPGRWSLRLDAVFLLSIEIETARAALFGFPRYMSNIPLPPESAEHYPGGLFPGYINALYREAADRQKRFPGNDARGLRVMAGAVQELAGVRVDHYVMVNLNGFVQVVDAMGGLWIDVPEPGVSDDRYVPEDGRGHLRVRLRPGCQQLDGTMALAFARSRHQDSDYHRMARQETTIAAMRRQFDPLAVLPRLPELFDAAGDNLYWTLRPEDVGPIAQLAARVDADRMQRVLFVPPEYKRELNHERIEKIRDKVRGIFEEPAPQPSPDATGGGKCPPPD